MLTVQGKDIPNLKCKTAYIIQRGESEYVIMIRKPNKGECYTVIGVTGKPVSFMSIEKAGRFLRYIPIRDIRLQLL
jgi:hypothetical protein